MVDVDVEVRARRRLNRTVRWVAPIALIATPWVAHTQSSTLNSGTAIGGIGTTAPTVSNPSTLTLPTDTAVVMPAASEPAFDALEATLGFAGTTDFDSFAAKLGIGPSATTLPALTSLLGTTGSTPTTGSQTLGTTSSPSIGTTLSTIGVASTSTGGAPTSSPSSIPAIGTSTQSIVGAAAMRTIGAPTSTIARVQTDDLRSAHRPRRRPSARQPSIGTQTTRTTGGFPDRLARPDLDAFIDSERRRAGRRFRRVAARRQLQPARLAAGWCSTSRANRKKCSASRSAEAAARQARRHSRYPDSVKPPVRRAATCEAFRRSDRRDGARIRPIRRRARRLG